MSRGAARRSQQVRTARPRNQLSNAMEGRDTPTSRKRKCSSDDEDAAAKVKHQHLSLANRILLAYTTTKEGVVDEPKEKQGERGSESNDPHLRHNAPQGSITTSMQLDPPLRGAIEPPPQRTAVDGATSSSQLESVFERQIRLLQQQSLHRQSYQHQELPHYSQLQRSFQAMVGDGGVPQSLSSLSGSQHLLRHHWAQQQAAADRTPRTTRSNSNESDSLHALLESSAAHPMEEMRRTKEQAPTPSPAGLEEIPSSSTAKSASGENKSPGRNEPGLRLQEKPGNDRPSRRACEKQQAGQQEVSLLGDGGGLSESVLKAGTGHIATVVTKSHDSTLVRDERNSMGASESAKTSRDNLCDKKNFRPHTRETEGDERNKFYHQQKRMRHKSDHHGEPKRNAGTSSSATSQERRDSVSHRDPTPAEDQNAPSSQGNRSRQERKKLREKQRRNDLNKGFGDLKELMFRIDPSLKTEGVGGPEDIDESRAASISRRRASLSMGLGGDDDCGDGDPSSLNRVELLRRAVQMLERIHVENEARKSLVARLGLKLTDTERTLNQLVQSISREAGPQRGLGGSSAMDIVRSQGQLPMRPPQHSIVPAQLAQELIPAERTPPIPGATALSIANVSASMGLRRPSLPPNPIGSVHRDPGCVGAIVQQSRPSVPQTDLTALQSIAASFLRTDTTAARNPLSNEESAHLVSLAQAAERQQLDAREVIRSSAAVGNDDEGKSDRQESQVQSKRC